MRRQELIIKTPKILLQRLVIFKKLKLYQLNFIHSKIRYILMEAFKKPARSNLNNFQVPTDSYKVWSDFTSEAQFDLCMLDDSSISFGQLAERLRIDRNKMIEFLHYKNILNQNNFPSVDYVNKEYFKLNSFTYATKSKKYQITIPQVTLAGQDFICNYFVKYFNEYEYSNFNVN